MKNLTKIIIIVAAVCIAIFLILNIKTVFLSEKNDIPPEVLYALSDGDAKEVEKAIEGIDINKLFFVESSDPNDPNKTLKYQTSMLGYAAAFNNNPEVIELLIKKGADIYQKFSERIDDANTAISNAMVHNNNPKITEAFLKNIDFEYMYINEGSKEDVIKSIITDASYNSNPMVLDTLLKNKKFYEDLKEFPSVICINYYNSSLGNNPEEKVEIMFNNGLDILSTNINGATALDMLNSQKAKILKGEENGDIEKTDNAIRIIMKYQYN